MSKSFLKKMYQVFNMLINSLLSLIYVIFFSSFSIQKYTRKCSSSKSNDECCIFGMGPSLNQILQKDNTSLFLSNKDIFTVNFFANSEYFTLIKPKYHIIIDPGFYNIFDDDDKYDKCQETISVFNKIQWDLYFLVPYQFRKSLILKKISNPYVHVVFINITPINGIRVINYYLYKNNLGMPFPQTVINAAIFMAIHFNYKNIHLFGVDQSWLKGIFVDENNFINVKLDHNDNTSDRINISSLSQFLMTQYRVFHAHEQLREYANYKNIEILNHVKGSFIDAYKKVE